MMPKNYINLTHLPSGSLLLFATILEKIKELAKSAKSTLPVHPIRILLVDDDVDDRDLFIEAISHIDPIITVETAENGLELISMMKEGNPPQVIFLDLNMPGKTGKECLEEIRQHQDWQSIPVYIFSTSANKKDIHDTYHSGANLYVLKPATFPELIGVIRKAFSFDWHTNPRLPQHDFVLINRM